MVSDTHVNLSNPVGLGWLAQVYGAIAARGPSFVLHCGDVTDTGSAAEYARYAQMVPASLRGLIHHVPGNHETRWDWSAKELYRQCLGAVPYSFDVGGVHFIGLDVTQVLQEPGHYGAGRLAWLDDDLHRVGPATPSIVFQHFPLGGDFYYVADQDRFLRLIAGRGVRAIFAGHIHRGRVWYANGLTQVAVGAVKDGPVYSWAEVSVGSGGAWAIRVSRVGRAAGDWRLRRRRVATVWLAGGGARGVGPGGALRPRAIQLGAVGGGQLPVAAEPAGPAAPRSVRVGVYPQAVFAGTHKNHWFSLARPRAGDRRWTGTADVSACPPGVHRLQVRITGRDGSWWEDTRRFAVPVPPGAPEVVWEYRVDGPVQGALQQARGVIIAASMAGQVTALALAGVRGPRGLWRAAVGPVYRQPAVDASAGTVFVPSADHQLYALDARTGGVNWVYRADAPVLSSPLVTWAGDQQVVCFSAGDALFTVQAASGRLIWAADAGAFSAGRVAADGARVYRGGGDGCARAFDLRSGELAWKTRLATGDQHHNLVHGPWDDTVLLADGIVLVSTVSAVWALDSATGATRWKLPASAMYPPSILLDGTPPEVLITTEYGIIRRVHTATGATAWQTTLGVRVLNSGAVAVGGTAWLQSVDGQLIGVELADGTEQARLQHSLAHCFSTPVTADGNLVITADQDGVIHAIRVG